MNTAWAIRAMLPELAGSDGYNSLSRKLRFVGNILDLDGIWGLQTANNQLSNMAKLPEGGELLA